jgi:hypothetical protein
MQLICIAFAIAKKISAHLNPSEAFATATKMSAQLNPFPQKRPGSRMSTQAKATMSMESIWSLILIITIG